MVADDWTEEQRNQFIVKDNVSFGEWDFGKLDAQFSFEAQIEFGIDRDFSFKMAKNEPKNEEKLTENEEIDKIPQNFANAESSYDDEEDVGNEENSSYNATDEAEKIAENEKIQHTIKTGGEIIIKYQNEYERERISKILSQFSIKYSCQ